MVDAFMISDPYISLSFCQFLEALTNVFYPWFCPAEEWSKVIDEAFL